MKHVGIAELRDVTEHVQHQAVLELEAQMKTNDPNANLVAQLDADW